MAALIVNTTAQLNTSGSDSPAYAGVVLHQGFFSSSVTNGGSLANGAFYEVGFYTGVVHLMSYSQGTASNTAAGWSHAIVFDSGYGTVGSSAYVSPSIGLTGGIRTSVSNDGLLTNIRFTNESLETRECYTNVMILSQ